MISIKVIKITEEYIEFDDGTKITDNHEQDCCENVYANFKALKDQGIKEKEFKKIKIDGVKNSGFKLNGYFIPCYNEQNGYYASNLELIIKHPDGSKTMKDITEFVEDKIF